MQYDEIRVGSKVPRLTVEMNPVRLVMYCAITWDFARLHYDPPFAQESGFSRPVVDPQIHGAFVSRMLSDWVSDSGRIRRLSLSYRSPCYTGDRIVYGGEVARKYSHGKERYIECVVTATNEKGEAPVAGRACLLFP